MTVELKWLIYTALLAGSLWIPFIVGVNTTDFPGKAQLFIRPPLARLPLRPMIYVAAWIVMLIFAWQVLSKAA
jgi:hypothetical protein